MKIYNYSILPALFAVIFLIACDKRDASDIANQEPLPLYCAFELRNNGMGIDNPNDIKPSRMMVCVVNNKGIVEAQQAQKVNFNGEVLFTFKAITPGSKRLYAYAISPQGETDDAFEAKNFVTFPTLGIQGIVTAFDGAGVTQFSIPQFSHESQLLGLTATVKGHTPQDANIIYSGCSEVIHSRETINTPKEVTLFPQMSRVEVQLFIDKETKSSWDSNGVKVSKASVSVAHLSQSSDFFFAKTLPGNKKIIDLAQYRTAKKPSSGWDYDVPEISLNNPELATYKESQTSPAKVVVYSAPIFSSKWGVDNDFQPKVALKIQLSNGKNLSALFPISTGDDTITVPSGAEKPAKGDLYPGYNYKLSLVISAQEVTVKYHLTPWDEKVIDADPFV